MGDTEALLLLGRAYALGLGAAVDLREALDWFTQASRRSSTRERGERGVAAARELERLEVQLASLERCEKTGGLRRVGRCGDAGGRPTLIAVSGTAARPAAPSSTALRRRPP